jgi:hypothetical protein
MSQDREIPEESSIETVEKPAYSFVPQDAANHPQQLESFHLHNGEYRAQWVEIPRSERLFIGSSVLAGVRQSMSGERQQRISAPRFAKDRDSPWLHHAMEFPACPGEIEMVENGVAPNHIKNCIGEGEFLPIGDDAFHLHSIGGGTLPCFCYVTGREIKRGDSGT